MNLPENPSYPLKGKNYQRVKLDMRTTLHKKMWEMTPQAHRASIVVGRPKYGFHRYNIVSKEAYDYFYKKINRGTIIKENIEKTLQAIEEK